jgi:hypothetical protein
MHLSSRQNKNRTYKNYNSKSIKKGKDTRAHRSLRQLPKLEWVLDSTLDSRQGFACASTTKPEPLQVENYKYSVVCSKIYRKDPYIEVEGSFYWLNRVSLEVMDGWAAIHMVGQPLLLISTDFRILDTLVDRLRSVATKSQPEPTQSVVGRPALVPLWLVVWPHVVYVSQTFMWWHYLWWNFKCSCNFLKCSNLVPMFLK